MLPDRVSNPGPLTYESGALPIALRGPAYEALIFASIQVGDSGSRAPFFDKQEAYEAPNRVPELTYDDASLFSTAFGTFLAKSTSKQVWPSSKTYALSEQIFCY